MKQEGPISLSLAARRVAAYWGLSRVTSNTQDRIRTMACQANVHCVQHGKHRFFWPDRLDPNTWREYRVPGEDEISRREARDLPPEEIANATLEVLEQQVSLPAPDLMREAARLLGFQRMGQTVEKCMRAGIDLLFKSGKASEQAGMIVHRSAM